MLHKDLGLLLSFTLVICNTRASNEIIKDESTEFELQKYQNHNKTAERSIFPTDNYSYPEVFSSEIQNGGIHKVLVNLDLNENGSSNESLRRVQKSVSTNISMKLEEDQEGSTVLRRDKFGAEIIEKPIYSEVMKSVPRPDQRSLVIIFDGTGSMLDDLVQLLKGAEAIISEVTQRDSNPIYNYIFVPFRDPYVGPKLVTQNLTKFLHEIKNLPLLGGGDCPESAVGGINLALESALPKSFIFVFTDATARDFGLNAYTIELIQEKQVTLTFLLTGFCNAKTSEGYKVFEKLATLSNGQIYNLQKTDIAEVLEGIKSSLDADLIPINYLYSKTPGTQSIDVPVDENLREFTVSVAGENPNITVKNPDDIEHANVSEVLNLSNLKVINVQDPQPGKWNVETEANSDHFIKLTGISDLKFKFGFSETEPIDMKDTNINPTRWLKNVLSVSPSNQSLVNNLTSVEIKLESIRPDMVKNITLPLHRVNTKTLPEYTAIYSTVPFEPPISMFKLYVNGLDSSGNPLRHLLSTALKAVPEEIPRLIAINSFVEVLQGENAVIECKVLSAKPAKVSWIRNNTKIGETENGINNIYRYDLENVQLKDAGEYICSTENSNGLDKKTINLIVKKKINPISVKIIESNMTATENDVDYQISCFVYPNQNVTYSWYFNGEEITSNSSGDIDVKEYNLVIRNVQRLNTGNYTCIANNDDIAGNDTGFLNVLYEPFIKKPEAENNAVFYGDSIQLECDAEGNPRPEIEWIVESTTLPSNFKNGNIREFSVENEGEYICRVSNGIGGAAEKKFFIQGKAKEPPKLLPINSQLSLISGTDFILSCECELCNPITNYFWRKSNPSETEELTKFKGNINTTKGHTQITFSVHNSTINDTGHYICHLENDHGYDEKAMDVQIFEPATVKGLYGFYKGNNFTDLLKVLEGESFSLQCDVRGQPFPIIQWVKHGSEITEHRIISRDNSTLEKDKATENDQGSYECISRNSYGYDVKEIHLQVVVPPKLRSAAEESVVMVKNGEKVVIECDIIGVSLSDIVWSFNTSNLNQSYIDPNNKYLLNFTVLLEDTGIYECTAENEAGSVTQKIFLRVLYEPKIYPEKDVVMNARIGENVTLICRVEAYPEPEIFWRFNGSLIRNSPNSTIESNIGDLQLKTVDTSKTGTYICEASNYMGTAQRAITLNIDYPPKITSKFPSTFKLLPNYVLSFECLADGSPTPIVFWTKNGTIISQNDPTSHILKLMSSGESQTGDYVCHAENSEGTDDKKIEIISIKKPHIIKDLVKHAPQNVTEGDPINIFCPLGNADNFTWYHENKHFDGENSQEIKLNKATRQHAGKYICVAENEAGIQNYTQEVLVFSPPDILSNRNEDMIIASGNQISLRVGENVTLKCSPVGYPKPKIQWIKDSVVLSTNPELHLNNVQFYHGGEYICNAENIFGVDTISYRVDVLVPPTPNISKKNWKEIFEGDDLEIECEAYGNPSPSVSWMKDGKELGIYNEILEIFSAQKEDRGTYICKLENNLGTEEIIFFLDILSSPKIISYPTEIAIVNNEQMELHCSAEGNPLPILAWAFNSKTILSTAYAPSTNLTNEEIVIDDSGNVIDYWNPQLLSKSRGVWQNFIKPKELYGKILKENETISLSLIIDDLKLKKSGIYVCYALNSLGSDEQKLQVDIQAPPYLNGRDIDKEKLVNKTLLEGLPLILSCLWNGSPTPDISWFQDHKFLNERPGYHLSRNNKTLTILRANSSHVGLYTCIATNAAGEDRRQFLVDILIPPKIHNFIKEEVLPHMHVTGKSTILECPATGNPKPSIFWVKQMPENSTVIEVLSESSDQLVLDDLEESGIYSCYVNNSLGFAEKQFSVEVLKMPQILDKWPSNLLVKEHQTIALHCRTNGSPKPVIRWYKDGLEIINGRFPNVNFNDGSKTIMKIPNARRKDSGIYICIANNKMGEIQRNVNVTVLRAAIWSEWEPWTSCSSSCGLGVKTRRRRCIVNGILSKDDNSCSGSNYESERCEMLPCPVSGGWSEWSKWTSCSKSCMALGDQYKPTRKRYRNCDSPKPAFGGRHCLGNNYEEEDCNAHICPINGGWSDWTPWSLCSATCGFGKKEKYRECNNPAPSFGGKTCTGIRKEVTQCFISPCPVNGGWSEWSSWSECSQTCGDGVRKRLRTCSNPLPKYGGAECHGASVEVLKCHNNPCISSDHSKDNENKKPFTPEIVYEIPDVHFLQQSEEHEHLEEHTEKLQYASASKEKVIQKDHTNGDYYDDVEENDRGLKVIVTYQNYRPIDPDIKQITFYPDKNPYKLERIIPCQIGFEPDSSGKCKDINECERSDYCNKDQICMNFIGSFRCICRSGFVYNGNKKRCEDIDECSNKATHDCSHGCRNTFGGYSCICPNGYSLGPNSKTCRRKLTMFRSGIMSDHPADSEWNKDVECSEGYQNIGNLCQDMDECSTLEHDCVIDQTCLNTKGSYLCIPTPCSDDYERNELTGQCVQMCQNHQGSLLNDSNCKEGAKISESISYNLLSLQNFDPSEAIFKIVNYGINQKALPETLFTIEPGKDSKYFKLETLPFKKGMSYLYAAHKIKREKLYKITVKAKSYDPQTIELLHVTNFVIFVYIL